MSLLSLGNIYDGGCMANETFAWANLANPEYIKTRIATFKYSVIDSRNS